MEKLSVKKVMEKPIYDEADKFWKYIFKQILTWFTILGTIVSIIMAFKNQYVGAIVLLVVIIIALCITSIHYVQKSRNLKNELSRVEVTIEKYQDTIEGIYARFENFCEMAHRIRQLITDVNLTKATESDKEREALNASITRSVLNQIETIFSHLVYIDCIASIMLPVTETSLKTVVYSDSATASRRQHPTTLEKGRGVAWKVFESGIPKVVNDIAKCPDFVSARENREEFYNSFICAPLAVENSIQGVINIDCIKTDVFHDKFKFLALMAGELIGLSMQLDMFLQNLKEGEE